MVILLIIFSYVFISIIAYTIGYTRAIKYAIDSIENEINNK